MVEISINKFNSHGLIVILLQKSHFFHKILINELPYKHVVLGANGKLWRKKSFYDQTFITIKMTW